MRDEKHEIDWGQWLCRKGDFHVRLVLRKVALEPFIRSAVEAKSHRAELGRGALVVLVKRVAPATPEDVAALAREGRSR